VVDEAVLATRLSDDFHPALADAEPVVVGDALRSLDAAAYQREIDRSWRDQRLAAYRAAVINLPKTPLPILSQLVIQTVRNKLSAVVSVGDQRGSSRDSAG